MLYDKRWDAKTAETKPVDPFTLPALVAWLETMPADEEYDYFCMGKCLFGQWTKNIDPSAEPVAENCSPSQSYDYVVNGEIVTLAHFNYIALCMPHSFGAALTRARKALSDQSHSDACDTAGRAEV